MNIKNEIDKIQKSQSSYARELLNKKLFGILSTISHDERIKGHPFGSITQYVTDNKGNLIIFISDISQHYINIEKNSKISITVLDDKKDHIMKTGRITLIGNAKKISNTKEVSFKYFKIFPEAKFYSEVHGFNFYKLNIKRAYLIKDFGNIHWISKDNLFEKEKNNFDINIIENTVEHINKDHINIIKSILDNLKISIFTKEYKMVYFDYEGMYIKLNYNVFYIKFDKKISSIKELKEILIRMSKKQLI